MSLVKRKLNGGNNNNTRLERWRDLKVAAQAELERQVIWDPTVELYRYDLDDAAVAPIVERKSVDPAFPFVFRGYCDDGGNPVNGAPTLKLTRGEALGDGDARIGEWEARSMLLRHVTTEGVDGDECVSSAADLVTEMRNKLNVKCDYWTSLSVGLQICTTQYRGKLLTMVVDPLVGHLLPPLGALVLDYVPFFLKTVYASSFCDEDECEDNPHLVNYCHNCSGEDPELDWYLAPKNCCGVDTSLLLGLKERTTSVALWTAIHRACADIPNLEELTHIN